MIPRILKKALICLGIASTGLLLTYWLFPDMVESVENQTYYLRCKWVLGRKYLERDDQSQIRNALNIKIIDIDERSVSRDKLGYYGNWKRNTHAQMINSLQKHYPAAILFDICFHEPEDSNISVNTTEILKNVIDANPGMRIPPSFIDSVASSIDYDLQFANATKNAGNVIHSVSMRNKDDFSELEWKIAGKRTSVPWLKSLNSSGYFKLHDPDVIRSFGVTNTKPVIDGTFPPLASSAMSIGFVNAPPNEDGIIRSVPLCYKYGDNNLALLSLSVSAACRLFGTQDSEVVYKPKKYLEIGKPFKVFKTSDGSIEVSFPNFSSWQLKALLESKKEIQDLKEGQSLEVSSFCSAGFDSLSGQYVFRLFGGNITRDILKEIQKRSLEDYLQMDEGEKIELLSDTHIEKSTADEWVLSSQADGNEVWMQKTDLKTILKINIDEIGNYTSEKDRLLFYGLTVTRKDGRLFSSIPVLTEPVLTELLDYSWDDVLSIPEGKRLEIGPSVRIPLDRENLHTINYIGPAKTFPYYSYYDILNDRVQGNLDGKIFIVGSSLPNLFDIKPVPHDISFPGVEIHASMLNSILQNTFINKWDGRETLILLASIAIPGTLLFTLFSPVLGWFVLLAGIFMHFLIALTLFGISKTWIPVSQPLFLMVYIYILSIAYRFLVEERNKKYLHSTFSAYLSPAIINDMYKKKMVPQLGGIESEITAFFTDIQGFSSFSEQIGSPRKLVTLLNEYLSEMTNTLLEYNGTLDKYEGDAIIAFFGAPVACQDHAKMACRTALKMQKQLDRLRKKWTIEGDKWPDIVKNMRMRIGINSGNAVIGNMGSSKRMNYTMMGDEVNLAARLESAAKQFGVYILIGENTYNYVSEEFEFRELDKIRVVGKAFPVKVYELISEKGEADENTSELKKLYHSGLQEFRNRNFAKAIELFTSSLAIEPNKNLCRITPSQRMIDISKACLDSPPPDPWDFTNELTVK